MSERLVIFGSSDDLIEVRGMREDEIDWPLPVLAYVDIRVDDGYYAAVVVEYDPDGTGEWRIRRGLPYNPAVTIVPARGEDAGRDSDDCPGYSDKAVIDMQGHAARRIKVRARPASEART